MDLLFEHRIPREPALVESSLLDRGFALALATVCPALAEARVIDYVDRGHTLERVTWFRARPGALGEPFSWLPAVTWIERVEWSRETRSGRCSRGSPAASPGAAPNRRRADASRLAEEPALAPEQSNLRRGRETTMPWTVHDTMTGGGAAR